jgi:3-hydroxyacyl-[acyl-carrier-protein] dehydratase
VAKEPIIDPATVDLSQVILDQAGIRRYNPQRFEMEQVTAVCFEDTSRHACLGYKDVTAADFWVRGHMPGMPLMPGVVQIEAAAQLCSYYVHRHELLGPNVTVGLGGLDEIRFREPVRPGDRLIIVAELVKLRTGIMCVCHFQEFVGTSLVCEGVIKGVALPTDALASGRSAAE